MLWSMLLMAAQWHELPAPPNSGLSAATVVQPQSALPGPSNFGLSRATTAAATELPWESYRATVTSYLDEPAPPPPPPPGPAVTPPPLEMGLSNPGAAAQPSAAPVCDGNRYVNQLYAQAYAQEDDCCEKCSWLHRLFQGCCGHCKSCGIHSTCDMIPHYAYFPKYHGYYYFRPYNYTHIAVQQQLAVRLGADPRNPYTTRLLDNLFANLPEPTITSSTAVRKEGVQLPLLEDLLDPK